MTELFIHQVALIDYAALDSHRGLVGESWIVDVYLSGKLNDDAMLLDFGVVKKQVKQFLDEKIDHRLLVPSHLSTLRVNQDGDKVTVRLQLDEETHLIYRAPEQAIALLETEGIDVEFLQGYLAASLAGTLPHNIDSVRFALYRHVAEGESLNYCHGLRVHQGNCQRLAHGHQSRIVIEVDGYRRIDLERAWSHRLHDHYLGAVSDIQARPEIAAKDYIQFAYTSAQGDFFLELPADRCYLLNSSTTAEMIAEHVLSTLCLAYPQSSISVSFLEGIGKGILASR
jgi:6-pyruvoyl-tetrahydropterin synthase